jgi:hypothetical protein
MSKIIKSEFKMAFNDKGTLKVEQIETEVDDAKDQHIHKSRQDYDVAPNGDDADRAEAIAMTKRAILASIAQFLGLSKEDALKAFNR